MLFIVILCLSVMLIILFLKCISIYLETLIGTPCNFNKKSGKSICGYAATSKSTTILNYCGINKDQIDYICDTTKEKIGKYTPGTHIPIKDMNYFYKNQPDSIYLFAWNHKKEILKKEKNYKGEWFSHVEI